MRQLFGFKMRQAMLYTSIIPTTSTELTKTRVSRKRGMQCHASVMPDVT